MAPLQSLDFARGPEDESEQDLLDRVRLGDAAAYGKLLRRWWKPLVVYAARIVGNVDAAEDIVQEAFVRLWERRGVWRPASTPRVLLYTITRNLALNDRKYSAARTRLLGERPLPFGRGQATPVQMVEGTELEVALDRALARLPAKRREILVLSRYDGLSRAEIAELTGLSQQTVANYLSRAVADLRRLLGAFLDERR